MSPVARWAGGRPTSSTVAHARQLRSLLYSHWIQYIMLLNQPILLKNNVFPKKVPLIQPNVRGCSSLTARAIAHRLRKTGLRRVVDVVLVDLKPRAETHGVWPLQAWDGLIFSLACPKPGLASRATAPKCLWVTAAVKSSSAGAAVPPAPSSSSCAFPERGWGSLPAKHSKSTWAVWNWFQKRAMEMIQCLEKAVL